MLQISNYLGWGKDLDYDWGITEANSSKPDLGYRDEVAAQVRRRNTDIPATSHLAPKWEMRHQAKSRKYVRATK